MSTLISLQDLKLLIPGRPCLVIGGGLTTFAPPDAVRSDIANLIARAIKNPIEPDRVPESLDALGQSNSELARVCRSEILSYVATLKSSAAAAALARGRWGAIVSLAADMCFEDEVRRYFDSQPADWKVTLIVNARTITRRTQTLTIYKLLGSIRDTVEDSSLALSRSDLLFRRALWAPMLRPLRDSVRDSAYLFLGTAEDTESVRDFLSILISGDPPFPSRLIFLRGDKVATDPVITSLAKGRTEICEVDAEWKEMLRVVQETSPFQMRLHLPSTGGPLGLPAQLEGLGHLISVPPVGLPSYSFGDRRQEVVDSLFRPLSVDWAPYQFDLDLQRTQTQELLNQVNDLVQAESPSISCVLVRGEAGVGKSTLAKRAALELRKQGFMVLWCRRQPTEASNSFRDLARLLKRSTTSGELRSPPIVFCDDPYALRLSVNDIFAPFDAEGLKAVLVVIARNTDYSLVAAGLRLPVIPSAEIEINFTLDDDETSRLPQFLVNVGAAPKKADGLKQVQGITSANSRDILCSFWYLLPDTRGIFSGSLEDEYFRLGGGDALTERWATEAGDKSLIARRAYEFVAVASGLDIGLPIEVLVRAVKIDYAEWLTLCSAGKPLWGLVYPVESPDGETIVYFTRNEVVTRILLRQLNGGIGKAGEYRSLRRLIAACDTATPAYREFLIDVLVKRHRTIAERYSDREGRELFEIAMTTFPVPDRVIAHHYGKWITDVGGDPTAGYEQLQRALTTPEFPLSAQEERVEFVHTSMAAAVVKRVAKRLQDRDSGLELIKRHLREASTPGFLSLHSVHVQANALLALQNGEDRISLECFIEAARSVERALQLTGSLARSRGRYVRDLAVMEDLKRRMIESLVSFTELQVRALDEFERTLDQLFLEAAARKGVLEAGVSDKGSDYNKVYQFLRRCASVVAMKKQQLSAGLRRARVDLVVRWRFQHVIGIVDWNEFLGDLLIIQDSPGQRDDALILFYTGIAYFQIGKITDGMAAFARSRSLDQSSGVTTQVRAFLRDDAGQPKQLQGLISGPVGRSYVQVPELNTDITVRQFQPVGGARKGATVPVWVAFSMQGPLAAFRQPTEDDLLLP